MSHFLRTAIVVAGGTGTRMRQKLPKQFLVLAGKPVLVHTLDRFLAFDPGIRIALVLHESCGELWENAAAQFLTEAQRAQIVLAAGGAERTHSVANGLDLLRRNDLPAASLVAVHDAVRPFLTQEMLAEAYRTAAETGAAVCCVPVKSSLRRKTPGGSAAVDRSDFYHVQTPQVFRFGALQKAYRERPHDRFTDDASLFEAMGNSVSICEGSYDNIKITTPEDLFVAEKLMRTPTDG